MVTEMWGCFVIHLYCNTDGNAKQSVQLSSSAMEWDWGSEYAALNMLLL